MKAPAIDLEIMLRVKDSAHLTALGEVSIELDVDLREYPGTDKSVTVGVTAQHSELALAKTLREIANKIDPPRRQMDDSSLVSGVGAQSAHFDEAPATAKQLADVEAILAEANGESNRTGERVSTRGVTMSRKQWNAARADLQIQISRLREGRSLRPDLARDNETALREYERTVVESKVEAVAEALWLSRKTAAVAKMSAEAFSDLWEEVGAHERDAYAADARRLLIQ